ncbi:MAG: DUF4271 domain-containing protein [Flavobacteriales bacterium]|nr:DUF4271 domain-containing protein [Flavobacteriales bacterium]NQX97441.1 DUF4271 domain-containing protein [Flavobacteriales bacterium]
MPTLPIYQSDSLQHNLDTIYGIENEALIPIRYTEIIKEKKPIKKEFNPSPHFVGVEIWQFLVLLIAVLLVGVVKAFSNNRYRQGIKALFNYTVAQEIIREEKVFFHRSNLLLTIVYVLTTSLFLYQLKETLEDEILEIANVYLFLVVVGFVLIVCIIKYIFSKVLSFVFDDLAIASEYIFNVSIYNNIFGVLLIPVLCIAYFTAIPFEYIILYFALPIGIITFCLRLIRVFLIGKGREVLYVYIFLYICTLEILPLVVLYWIFIHK